jgi:hypothetical protein
MILMINLMNDMTVCREDVHAAEAISVELIHREFQFFNCRILFLQHTVKLTKNKKTYCYRVEMVLLNSTVDLILAP